MPRSDPMPMATAVPLFAALSPAHARALTLRRMERGEHLFLRGDAPAFLYGVVAGEIRLVRRTAPGDEIVLQRARRGILAEASVDQPRYHCDAVVTAAAEIAALPLPVLREALEGEEFSRRWISHLAGELRRSRAMCERLSLRTAAERIVHYVETEGRDGECVLGMTRKALAAELGLTHEALYRALARLAAEGVLEVGDGPHGLRVALAGARASRTG